MSCWRSTWLCGVLLCLACVTLARPERVHLIIAGGLDLQDIRHLSTQPELRLWVQQASWGLMSVGGERRGSPGVFGAALATGLRGAPDGNAAQVSQWVRDRRAVSLAELLKHHHLTVYHTAPDDGRSLLGVGNDPTATLTIQWIPQSTSGSAELTQALIRAVTCGSRVVLAGAPADMDTCLTPVLAGSVELQGGLLTSDSTRASGLVKDANLAPFIARVLHVPIPDVWRSMKVSPVHTPASRWQALTRLQASAEQQRRLIVPVILLVAVTIVGALGSVWIRRSHVRAVTTAGLVLCTLSSLPLMLHLLGLLSAIAGPLSDGLYLSMLLAGLALAGWGVSRALSRTGLPALYMWICLVTILMMVADAAMGCQGARFSLIGAYLVSGIRLYGLGNEYLGVILGGLGVAWLAARPAVRPFISALWLLCILAMGTPWMGANLGGFAASLASFWSVLVWQRRPYQPSWIRVLMIIGTWLAAWLLQAVPVAIDIVSGSNTHMGDVWRRTNGDPGDTGWMTLIESKLRLMSAVLTNPFTLLAAIGAVIGIVSVTRLIASRRQAVPQHLISTFVVLTIPVILMNDSGIVSALIVTGYLAVWVVLMQGESYACQHFSG